MDLISLLVAVIIIAVICYVVSLIPMDALIKRIIFIVIGVFILLWLLQTLFGVGGIRLR